MRRIGVLLVAIGIIGVILSSVKISRPREVARIGSMRINVHEDRRPLVPAWVGGVVMVAGVVLAAAGRRTTRHAADVDDALVDRGR